MKGGTVQINWHDSKPVLTLDFHPHSGLLATGGADFDIKLWVVNSCQGQKKVPTASYQNSLSYHSAAVNTIRFSPSGEQLASGADGGEMIIWKLHQTENAQTWKVLRTLSFHRKDVLDLQWSSDDAFLISGSVDNSCIIWNVNKGSVHQILDAHCHYVQGVAWDPSANYVASLSADRSCRIYANKPQAKSKGNEKLNFVCQHVITKGEQHQTDDSKSTKSHIFHDETLPSFFRRLAWSPDGSFLIVPAGIYKLSPTSEPINTAYVFSGKDLSRPALQLPGANKPVVAVRFCPKRFCLRGLSSGSAASFFKLPYRLVFGIVTLNSLYIYDTESAPPIALMAGLHYAAITDITWSADARYLASSSQDGYCTLVEFENDELGSPYSSSVFLSSNTVGENKDTADQILISGQEGEEMVVDTNHTTGLLVGHKDKEEIGKADGKVGSEEESSAKAEEMVIDMEEREDEEKNASEEASASKKPVKRRITPMAIDP